MPAIARTGTVNHTRHAHAWAPAALASMGVVFGDIGTSPFMR
jgi:K+ transporter